MGLFRKTGLPMLAILLLVTCAAVAAAAKPSCEISANFNGTPIEAGNTIWFNSVFTIPGLNASKLTAPLTISFTGVTITLPGRPPITAPNASITWMPGTGSPTTTFVPTPAPGTWTTTLYAGTHLPGNAFLDAVAFRVPSGGLPGGTHPVSWQGVFSSTATPPLQVKWQWGAAVYTQLSKSYTTLDVEPADQNLQASIFQLAGSPEMYRAYVVAGATGDGGSNYTGYYSAADSCSTAPVVPPGSCIASGSLSVLVSGANVTSYVPKGAWETGSPGISVANLEGSSIAPTFIPTGTDRINSCASNPITGETLCTANNTNYYSLSRTTISGPLSSTGSGSHTFSGGPCINCGVAMDATDNYALIGLGGPEAAAPGFELLNLAPATPTPFWTYSSPSGNISEDPLIDPIHHLLLSATEDNVYELVDISKPGAPVFYDQAIPAVGGELDSSAEDCATGIALAPAEFSSPVSRVVVADLTQAKFSTPVGTPPRGTWTAPYTLQSLSESVIPEASSCGSSVAQGTHTGILSGEFGGDAITAVALPTASGSGTPALRDWVTCNIGNGFVNGEDPHTMTAYVSEGATFPAGDALAVLADWGTNGTAASHLPPGRLAVVDLTRMLNPSFVARTSGPGLGHACLAGPLPATVLSFVAIP
jgi:hypothetical protein